MIFMLNLQASSNPQLEPTPNNRSKGRDSLQGAPRDQLVADDEGAAKGTNPQRHKRQSDGLSVQGSPIKRQRPKVHFDRALQREGNKQDLPCSVVVDQLHRLQPAQIDAVGAVCHATNIQHLFKSQTNTQISRTGLTVVGGLLERRIVQQQDSCTTTPNASTQHRNPKMRTTYRAARGRSERH